ncbi:alpha/beta family hydrolase [Nocardia asteroides]|uniref:alpha/beta hydrolase family protein n=1 Tax=Nocardia asteroides TaxID=1824 RepID=UPI001E588B0F|nr:alpha/beta family hydrolase [Nocardia asteroides]UGT59048.1 alpha/beta hydrolase [Nocardia asteroides]
MRIDTSAGQAEVEIDAADEPSLLVLLTHGSGGGIDARDLLTVRDLAFRCGAAVARVLQPYRVAGARAPGSAAKQDTAWLEVVAALRERYGPVPLVQGGRSNGARVACRTATAVGARGVLALSFPLHPPGKPERSRREELLAASGAEVVVINGGSDPFGIPDAGDVAELHVIEGQPHSFRRGFDEIEAVVEPWLRRWAGQPSRR